jgi:thioredoxin reductase (NADPH)
VDAGCEAFVRAASLAAWFGLKELLVFSRPGCHLCEEVVDRLEPLCRAHGVLLRVADVDLKPEWRERFGLRIPVVCAGDQELSGYPLQDARIVDWLNGP